MDNKSMLEVLKFFTLRNAAHDLYETYRDYIDTEDDAQELASYIVSEVLDDWFTYNNEKCEIGWQDVECEYVEALADTNQSLFNFIVNQSERIQLKWIVKVLVQKFVKQTIWSAYTKFYNEKSIEEAYENQSPMLPELLEEFEKILQCETP